MLRPALLITTQWSILRTSPWQCGHVSIRERAARRLYAFPSSILRTANRKPQGSTPYSVQQTEYMAQTQPCPNRLNPCAHVLLSWRRTTRMAHKAGIISTWNHSWLGASYQSCSIGLPCRLRMHIRGGHCNHYCTHCTPYAATNNYEVLVCTLYSVLHTTLRTYSTFANYIRYSPRRKPVIPALILALSYPSFIHSFSSCNCCALARSGGLHSCSVIIVIGGHGTASGRLSRRVCSKRSKATSIISLLCTRTLYCTFPSLKSRQ